MANKMIKGNLQEISKGVVWRGSLTHSEFIRVDNQRTRHFYYDNYIGTALSNAVEDETPIEISTTSACGMLKEHFVVAVKRGDGEVSRANFRPTLMSIQMLFMGLFLALIVGGVSAVAGGFGGFIAGSLVGYGLILFWVIYANKTFSKAKNAFGKDT